MYGSEEVTFHIVSIQVSPPVSFLHLPAGVPALQMFATASDFQESNSGTQAFITSIVYLLSHLATPEGQCFSDPKDHLCFPPHVCTEALYSQIV